MVTLRPCYFPVRSGNRGLGGAFAPVFLALLVCGCTPGASGVSYIGMNFRGDRLEWNVDSESGAWSVWNRDRDLQFSGDFLPTEEPALDGFLTTETAEGAAWAVEREGRGLITDIATEDQGLALNWSASTAIDTALYRPLIEGNYSCVRLREDGAGTEDIVFMTLNESSFSMMALDSGDTHLEELPFGVSIVEPGEGDVEGTWDLEGVNDQEIVLESDEGAWEGVLFPGTMMVLRSPISEGLLACMWSPLPNTQLSVFDGDYQLLESRRGAEDYEAVGSATVDVFGDAGEFYRRAVGGEEEEYSLTERSQVYYVGNLIAWQIMEGTWLYQAVAADFYIQWTQQGGGGGEGSPPRMMNSFGLGFHPRDFYGGLES